MTPSNQSPKNPQKSPLDKQKSHPSLTSLDLQKGYIYRSTWTDNLTKQLSKVPPEVRQQAIDFHERWRKGDKSVVVKLIQEWKSQDIWEMVIGNWRALGKRLDPITFEWRQFGSAQAIKKLLNAQVTWYVYSSFDAELNRTQFT